MNNGFPYPETITASGRPRKSRVDMKHTPTCHVSYYLWGFKFQTISRMVTLTKFNKDTKNDGLWIVYPFKYGYFWYLCSISGWLCYVSFFLEYLIVCFYVFIDILRKDDNIFPPGTSSSFCFKLILMSICLKHIGTADYLVKNLEHPDPLEGRCPESNDQTKLFHRESVGGRNPTNHLSTG